MPIQDHDPQFEHENNWFRFSWRNGVVVTIDKVLERGTRIRGEVMVTCNDPIAPHVLGPVDCSLSDIRERDSLAKKLADIQPNGYPWVKIVETTFAGTVTAFRRGEPVEDLSNIQEDDPTRDFITHCIPQGETSIIFGDGGTLKSTLAVAIALTAATGHPIIKGWNLVGPPMNVLYLDWETNKFAVVRRARGIAEGAGLSWPIKGFYYRYMTTSIAQDGERLREECIKRKIGLVIADSATYMSGAEPEKPSAAVSAMETLRSLKATVTRIVIGHISKETSNSDRRGRRRMYGGAPWENGARCVWDVRREEETQQEVSGFDDDGEPEFSENNEVRLALYNTKANDKMLERPVGIMVRFHGPGQPGEIIRTDVPLTGTLSGGLTQAQRIVAVLGEHHYLPVYRIAEMLEVGSDAIERQLKRMENVIKLDREWSDPVTGRKVATVYALKHRQEEREA